MKKNILYVGLDVHKNTIDVYIYHGSRKTGILEKYSCLEFGFITWKSSLVFHNTNVSYKLGFNIFTKNTKPIFDYQMDSSIS